MNGKINGRINGRIIERKWRLRVLKIILTGSIAYWVYFDLLKNW